MQIKNAHVVIESIDSEIIGVHVFDNSLQGREEAKACFTDLATEQTDERGERFFSDSQIEKGWKNRFLFDGGDGSEEWTVSVHIAE